MPNCDWENGFFRSNDRAISSEVIDDEAIIMNHDSGIYFNTLATGSLIWQLICEGTTRDRILVTIATHFTVEAEAIRDEVAAFIAELAHHDLIADCAPVADAPLNIVASIYSQPKLGVHTDLADLLLLDPIHDVSQAGWPSPREP